jgi:uncharacterized membrane protein (DUF2068 family)
MNAAIHSKFSRGVRAVAIFEALKGIIVLCAGFGLFALVHHDLQAIAERLVRYTHLNPARHYPQVFIEAASRINDARLRTLAALALAYAAGRLVEAYGLWRMKTWAEWFAVISGAVYVPIEVDRLFRHATFLGGIVLLTNTFIVTCIAYHRWLVRRGKA